MTYHDPCYLGRHNEVYAEPRELVGASGVRLAEMPRHADRSFCCGAGGARMWMEEKIGKRINLNRVDEALGTGAEKIATGCPFCRVMLSDGLTQRQSEEQGAEVEVLDVAQLLLAAVKRGGPGPDAPVDDARRRRRGGGDHSPVRHAGQRLRAGVRGHRGPGGRRVRRRRHPGGASPKGAHPDVPAVDPDPPR